MSGDNKKGWLRGPPFFVVLLQRLDIQVFGEGGAVLDETEAGFGF